MTGFFMLSGYAMTLGYGKKDFKEWNDYKTFYIPKIRKQSQWQSQLQ